jgi:hypothetical protein
MKKTLIILLLLAGCAQTGMIRSKIVTTYPDGAVTTTETVLRAPQNPRGSSSLISTTNGVTASLSASQSLADLEGVIQDGKNKRLLYAGCAALLLLGGIALALPNMLVSNKDAMLIMACGGAGFAVLRYVEASENYMGYVVPVAIVAGCVYISWQYISKKAKNDEKTT